MAEEEIDISEIVLSIANAVVPLLIIAILGFVCVKGKVLRPEHIKGLNTYLMRFGVPIMFFNALYARKITSNDVKYCFVSTISAMFTFVVVALVSLINNAICKCKHIEFPELEIVPGLEGIDEDNKGDDEDENESETKSSMDKSEKETKKKEKKEGKNKGKKTKQKVTCKEMWSLKPITFTSFISDFIISSYPNSIFAGQPLMQCIMGDVAATYYPFIGDLGFMVIVFAFYTALLEVAKWRREKNEKKYREAHPNKGKAIMDAEQELERRRSSVVGGRGSSFIIDERHSIDASKIPRRLSKRKSAFFTDIASFATGYDYARDEDMSDIIAASFAENLEEESSENTYDGNRSNSSNMKLHSRAGGKLSVDSSVDDSDQSDSQKTEEGFNDLKVNSGDKNNAVEVKANHPVKKPAVDNNSNDGEEEEEKKEEEEEEEEEKTSESSESSNSLYDDMNMNIDKSMSKSTSDDTVVKNSSKNNKSKKCCSTKTNKCCIAMNSSIAGRVFLKIVTLPLLHGSILGLIISFIPFTVPEMFVQLVTIVSNSCIAVAIFVIGMFMAANLTYMKNIRWIYHVIMKLVVYPIIVIAVLKILNVDNFHARVSMICHTTSTATMSFSFLFDYGGYFDRTPSPIVIGLVLLFPQQIAIQLIASKLFPADLKQEEL